MKRLLPVCLGAVALTLSLSGCKTTEANYKNAYETALRHQKDRQDAGVLEGIELKNTGALEPKPVEIDGVTLPMVTAWVLTGDKAVAPIDSLGKFTVVVAQFKQVFNASQMKKRLSANPDYSPLLLKLSNGNYLVGVNTTDDPTVAMKQYEHVKADSAVFLKPPFPFVFRAGQIKR